MISFEKSVSKVDELKNIWLACFEEDTRAVDLFFENAMQFAEVYCAKSDEKIVSALYLIGAHLNGKKAHYIFGVATLPEFRGRGIMGNLMEYALNDAKQNGDVYSLLFPANEKLYNFYAKFGYKANCTAKSRAFTRNELEKFELADSEYNSNNILLQNNNFIKFASRYYEIYGIRTLCDENCFALIEENDNQAEIFYSVYDDFDSLKRLVLENTTAQRLVFTGSSADKLYTECKSERYGMIKSLDDTEIPNDVYIGITLN